MQRDNPVSTGIKAGHSELDVSVVLPIYQESHAIEALVPALIEVFSRMGRSFEIIAVDDGSKDETGRTLASLRSRHAGQLRVIQHMVNRGNGAALRSGIRAARGEYVVTMDADGQHSPGHIPALLAKMPPYDLVIGARTAAYAGPWYRNWANRVYNRFAGWLSQRKIEDLTSGFRAMRREVAVHFLPLFPEGFSAPTTTTLGFLKAGYSVAFVPVEVGQRTGGTSKIRLWRDGLRFFSLILRMIMIYDPLRIFIPTGVALAGLGTLAWVAGVVNAQRLVFPNSTIFLYTAALLVWLLGMVSDQVSSNRVHYFGDESLVEIGPEESDRQP
jgi:glycosyltransferase involved in cell wall biosynthesis